MRRPGPRARDQVYAIVRAGGAVTGLRIRLHLIHAVEEQSVLVRDIAGGVMQSRLGPCSTVETGGSSRCASRKPERLLTAKRSS